MNRRPTAREVEAARTPRGGWTKAQLAEWGVPWPPPKGWKDQLLQAELPRPAKAPCGTCPYRRDVPSGLWNREEYAKLPRYDGETGDQIMQGGTGLFMCHRTPANLCAGWVGCHDMDHAAAVRFNAIAPEAHGYVSPVPLFASGAEAAAHGMRDIDAPGARARRAIAKLLASGRMKLRLPHAGRGSARRTKE